MTKDSENLKKAVFSGMFWRFGEQISSQLVSFIVSIILARLLEPKEYGIVAITTVFITIANVFVTDGFGKSLIQKKDADNTDFSTVFYFNILISWVVYLIIFFSSPYIAKFYNIPILTSIMRVLGLILPISGINAIQQAYVSRHMLFQRFFWSTLVGITVSGILGIFMAYTGFGIWALVGQQLCNSVINSLVLWITVRWRPTKDFNYKKLIPLFDYGWKILLTNIINSIYDNLRSLLMGKVYSSVDLAYYNRGMNYPNLLVSNITIALSSVLFPAMSKIQSDKSKMKKAIRKSISMGTYIVFPLMAGLAGIAHNLVLWMLTEKWLMAVPYMQIACIFFALYPINITNLQAIMAIGKSSEYLKLSILKKGIGVIFLIISIPFGPYVMVGSEVIVGLLAIFTNVSANRRYFAYTFRELFTDCFKNLFMTIIMLIIIILIGKYGTELNIILCLALQVIIGGSVYILLSIICNSDDFKYLVKNIKLK